MLNSWLLKSLFRRLCEFLHKILLNKLIFFDEGVTPFAVSTKSSTVKRCLLSSTAWIIWMVTFIQFTLNSSSVCRNWLQKSKTGQFFEEFEAKVASAFCFKFSTFLSWSQLRSSEAGEGSSIPLALARRAMNSEMEF